VFPGRTKSFDAYVGTTLLKQVAEEITIPAFAIGGIDAANVQGVVAAGFHRIAVNGAIRDADDPAVAAVMLRRMLPAIPPNTELSLNTRDR
jgi:thiamine-phosphate pyrophosphorylase